MNSFWWKVRESNPLLIQGVQDVAAAVVGCRSILSVGVSFPVAGLLLVSGFFLPCIVVLIFRLIVNQRTIAAGW
jgi:hypothetical protein